MNYEEYIHSNAWRHRRRMALAHYGHRCESCGSHNHLHVHHRTYERLGHEHLTDLRILCEACHDLVHETQQRQHRDLDDATDMVTSTPAIPSNPDQPILVRDLFPIWLHHNPIRFDNGVQPTRSGRVPNEP